MSNSRCNAQRTMQDYQDATGCSRVRATIHWALTCYRVTQTNREQAPRDPEETIELTNFVVGEEARAANYSGEER